MKLNKEKTPAKHIPCWQKLNNSFHIYSEQTASLFGERDDREECVHFDPQRLFRLPHGWWGRMCTHWSPEVIPVAPRLVREDLHPGEGGENNCLQGQGLHDWRSDQTDQQGFEIGSIDKICGKLLKLITWIDVHDRLNRCTWFLYWFEPQALSNKMWAYAEAGVRHPNHFEELPIA